MRTSPSLPLELAQVVFVRMFGVLAVTVYLESGVVAASATQKGFRIFGLAFTFTVLAYCQVSRLMGFGFRACPGTVGFDRKSCFWMLVRSRVNQRIVLTTAFGIVRSGLCGRRFVCCVTPLDTMCL